MTDKPSETAHPASRETFRIFLGCPLPADCAHELNKWALSSFPSTGFRVTPVERLHATILFFGEVDESLKDVLARETGLVRWDRLSVRLDSVRQYGRNAIALRLVAPGDVLTKLGQRLFSDAEIPDDPLARLYRQLPKARSRRPHETQSLDLHVTVARTRNSGHPRLETLIAPQRSLELNRLVLYQSINTEDGLEYRVVAEADQPIS
ncbi:MAG: hypothetical protein P4L46_15115 [Fimbriimonas sp.]|nr:hypothetical protein [Fimbriimonas sp.]